MLPCITQGVAWAAMGKINTSKLLLDNVEQLRSVAAMCLAPDHPIKLNELEYRLLYTAERDIIPALTTVLTALESNEQALNSLHTLIECIKNIGPTTVSTECQKESWRPKIETEQAEGARKARAESNEEKALLAAIEEFYPNKTCEHPFTTANQILERVNKRLARDKYPPVSRHVVYRRLGKLPRS
jgi:hypothetical protein